MKRLILLISAFAIAFPVFAQGPGRGPGRGQYGREQYGPYGRNGNGRGYERDQRYDPYGRDSYRDGRYNPDHGMSIYGDVPYGFDFWIGGDWLLGWQVPEYSGNDLGFRTRNSVEIGIPDLIGMSWSTPYYEFTLGAGTMSKFYKNKSGLMYEGAGGNLVTGLMPSGATRTKSMIRVRSLTLLPTLGVNLGEVTVSAGPMFNFNVSAKTLSKYNLDGTRQKEYGGRIDCRPLTVDLYVGIKWDGMGVYFKYAPKSPLDPAACPDFTVWSFGLVI